MDRRAFIGTLAGGLLVTPLAAEGQQTGKIPSVGYLRFGPSPNPDLMAQSSLEDALRGLGWVEGQNLLMVRRFGESTEQLHAVAAELGRLKVDVLVVPSAGLARIASAEAKNTAIVIVGAGDDLARIGLLASLARPGGNITGSQILQDELFVKRLELLKEVRPNLSRVVFFDESITHKTSSYAARVAAARSLGLELHVYIAARPEDTSVLLRERAKKGINGLVVESTPFTFAHEKEIIDLADKQRIVATHSVKRFVIAGGLISYGADVNALFRRAAYVDKILKGAKPADLPVQQPTKFELAINLKTARALGLTIPPSLLQRADQVIE
jgi:putative tryptophan/tyrosine transport system substrate-binding protein